MLAAGAASVRRTNGSISGPPGHIFLYLLFTNMSLVSAVFSLSLWVLQKGMSCGAELIYVQESLWEIVDIGNYEKMIIGR